MRRVESIARAGGHRGFRYLAELLRNPGRQYAAADLAALVVLRKPSRSSPSPLGAAPRIVDLPDGSLRRDRRRRLVTLSEELKAAGRACDRERAVLLRTEIGILEQQLADGDDRKSATPQAEHARATVTQALRDAISSIRAQNVELGDYLASAIRTGPVFSYRPIPGKSVEWNF
ncbi:MAG TPA: hypothetical protein VEL28_17000 [Candidatus Binatia bacterium]|nr:hypothetical protein [Candidatus Binatia bacterium]